MKMRKRQPGRALANARRFLKNAIDRRRHPERFVQHSSTPFDEVYRDGIMSVRHYRQLEDSRIYIEGEEYFVHRSRFRTPLVLVPPLGVFAWIFDLMIERSLVRYFLAHGFDVYLIDWGNPSGPDYAELSLENYVLDWFPKAMEAIRAHSGEQEVSVMGYCMGGLLSLFYLASSQDEKVRNLVTIASPVDVTKMGMAGKLSSLVQVPTKLVRRYTGFRIEQLDPQKFHVPGKWVSFAFKMSSPLSPLTSYFSLVRNLADTDYVTRYMSMNEWFNNMADYPGGTVLEMIKKLGLHNRLAKGLVRIGGRSADFRDIKCDLLAFAGDSDAIVPIAAAYKIMDVVGSRDKRFHLVPGGHAGVFTGGTAASTTWQISKEWLAKRSDRNPDVSGSALQKTDADAV